MMKPPIIRPQVEVPTVLRVEYYEVILPNGGVLIKRDNRGNYKTTFDDEEEAESAVREYLRIERRRMERIEREKQPL